MKKYGQIISKLRKQNGLTQEQLGKKLNVSYQAVSKWENNLSEPDLATIEKITEIFGISIADFFDMANVSENNSTIKGASNIKESKNFIKTKPWYLVAGLGILIVILSLCAFLIPVKYSKNTIFNKYNDSVFCLSLSNEYGSSLRTGFFINNSGLAATICNVNSYMDATIKLGDNKVCKIEKIVGFDKENNLTILQTNIKNTRPVVFGNCNNIEMGDRVYSITYSTEKNSKETTLSEGMVYKVESDSKGTKNFQTTASVKNATNGGLIFNVYGEVIGIISGNLTVSGIGIDMVNVCIPAKELNNVEHNLNLPFEENYYRHNNPKVSFMSDGEVFHSTYTEYGGTIDNMSPTKTGYQFVGWYANENFTKPFDFSKKIIRNTKAYAKWQANKYTIRFSSEFGSGTMPDLLCEYGKTYTLPKNNFIYEHHYFVEWKNGSKQYEDCEKVKNLTSEQNGVVFLTARWDLVQYQLHLLSTNNNVVSICPTTIDYTINQGTISLPNISANYYTFLGWSLDEDSSPIKNYKVDASQGGNKTFYAHWEPVEYTITYWLDGGTFEETAPTKYTYESGTTFPKITKGAYIFGGWKIRGTEIIITEIEKFSFGKNLILDAIWSDDYHTISAFTKDGKQVYSSRHRTSYFPISVDIDFVDDYYYFDYNYYLDQDCQVLFKEYIRNEDLRFESAGNYNIYLNAIPATQGIIYSSDNKIAGYEGTSSVVYVASFHNGRATSSTLYESFKDNQTITDIYLPDSIYFINQESFYNCTNLKYVRFPKELIDIGFEAFYNTALTSVMLPESLTCVYNAFQNCTKLESISLPKNMKSLYSNAFANCVNLKTIVLPENLERLDYRFFYNCTSLQEINIPDSVEFFDRDCIYNTGIYNNPVNWIENGLYYKNILFDVDKNVSNFTIQDGTKYVASELFYESKIETISIPESVQIKSCLFHWCFKLKHFEIPKNMTEIPYYLIKSCYNLETVIVHSSVVNIGSGFVSASSDKLKILFECNEEKMLSYKLSTSDSYYERYEAIPKFFYSNEFIEDKNTWCYVEEQIAIWKDSNTITINEIDYTFCAEQPQAAGNYWYYNQDNEIALW